MNFRMLPSDSYTNTCYSNMLGIYDQTVTAMNYIGTTQNSTIKLSDLKDLTFAYLTILEYIYPVSKFCYVMPEEIKITYAEFSIF
jgi:hypothetical protein